MKVVISHVISYMTSCVISTYPFLGSWCHMWNASKTRDIYSYSIWHHDPRNDLRDINFTTFVHKFLHCWIRAHLALSDSEQATERPRNDSWAFWITPVAPTIVQCTWTWKLKCRRDWPSPTPSRPGTSRADQSTESGTFQFATSSARHLETGPKWDCSASDGQPTCHLKQIGNDHRFQLCFACQSHWQGCT